MSQSNENPPRRPVFTTQFDDKNYAQQYEFPPEQWYDAEALYVCNVEVYVIPRNIGNALTSDLSKLLPKLTLPAFYCPVGRQMVIRLRAGRVLVEFEPIHQVRGAAGEDS